MYMHPSILSAENTRRWDMANRASGAGSRGHDEGRGGGGGGVSRWYHGRFVGQNCALVTLSFTGGTWRDEKFFLALG